VKPFRFRALVTLGPPTMGAVGRHHPSGTSSLMVHVCRVDEPSHDKYFPATIARDLGLPIGPS
jgi:hypothetical protein